MRSIQRMMNLVEKGGRILPFGKLRHAGNWARLMRYWHQGGEENIKNMLTLGAMEYLGFDLPKPPPPRVYPDYGVFDPLSGQSYSDLAAYRSAVPVDPEKPVVGLLFYGGMHFSQSLVPAREFARQLKHTGFNLIPVFATAGYNLQAIQACFFSENKPMVDAVVYFQWFQMATFIDSTEPDTIRLLKNSMPPFSRPVPCSAVKLKNGRKATRDYLPLKL